MTAHTTGGLPYVQGSDALTDYPTVSLELATKLDEPVIAAGSPLPASPTDGQTVILVVDPGSSFTIQRWRLRWVAAISRWVFLGGGALFGYHAFGQATGTTWAAQTPTLAIPRGGRYLARFGFVGTVASGTGMVAGSLLGPGQGQSNDLRIDAVATALTPAGAAMTEREINFTAAGNVNIGMYGSGSSPFCANRHISLTPVMLL